MNKCCACNSKKVAYVRHTQFSGDHPFCLDCAPLESNFLEDNTSYFYWETIPVMKFKMRQPPKKPAPTTYTRKASIYEDISLQEILDQIPSAIDKSNVLFSRTRDYYDYDGDNYFYWQEPEDKEDFDKKLAKYEKQLASYNEWAETNKDKIVAYETAKKKLDQERALANTIDKKKQLEKELTKLEKQLKKLQ